ncbi:MAG: HEAT repeat domain-containing protein, partial [Planctomycetaceae bacterium]
MTNGLLADDASSDGTTYSADDLSDMLHSVANDCPPETSTPLTTRQGSNQPKSEVPTEEAAREAVLRSKIAVSQDLLAELIRERDAVADGGKKKKRTSPSRFEVHWEKTLRQAKVDAKLLCTKIEDLGATGDTRAVSILKPFAHSKRKAIRKATAKALREIDSLESSFVLLSLLKDRKPKVAKAAFIGLSMRLNDVLVSPLLAYGIQNPSTRAVAARHFGKASKAQATSLIDVVTSDAGDIGLFALQMFGRSCDTESVSDLAPLTKHESPEFRAAAIEALIKTQNKQVVRFLNRALTDPDEQVRAKAAAGLSHWSSESSARRLLTLLKDRSVEVRRNAATALVKTPTREFLGTIVEVLKQESDEATQLSLIQAVGQIGSVEHADVLYSLTKSESLDTRVAALRALTKVKDKRALPLLVSLLKDPDERIREKAATGIGFNGNLAGIPRLSELMKSDRSQAVRIAAVRALGNIGSSECIPVLKGALQDEAQIRCQAVIALRSVGDEKVVPLLLDRLYDTAPEVRYNAVMALGELKASKAIPPLRRMIEDPNDMVQRAVHKALEELGVSVSSDLWKRRFQRSSAAVRDVFSAIKLAGPVLPATVVLVMGAVYWLASGSLGWTAQPPIVVKNTLQATISPDGKQVVVVRQGGVVDCWNVPEEKLTARIGPDGAPVGALFEPDSKSVLLLGNGQGYRWDLSPESPPTPSDAAFQNMQVNHAHNASRTRVITKSLSSTYFVNWDASRHSETFGVPPGFDQAMAISPDGMVAAVVSDKNDIKLISLEGDGEVASYSLAFDAGMRLIVSAIAFSPDGSQLAYALNSGEVTAMD